MVGNFADNSLQNHFYQTFFLLNDDSPDTLFETFFFGGIFMSKNEFKAGNKVKIGFMVLTVIEQSKDSVYYRPKAWILESSKGVRYQFTPYYGLERL